MSSRFDSFNHLDDWETRIDPKNASRKRVSDQMNSLTSGLRTGLERVTRTFLDKEHKPIEVVETIEIN